MGVTQVTIVEYCGAWAIAINGKIERSGLTYEEAEEIRQETLDLIRTEQQAAEREELRRVFGCLYDE